MTEGDRDRVRGEDMADVDRSDDPQARVNYLDSVTRCAIDMKVNSYTLLDINGGDRVLDVGCGAGDDVRRIAAIVAPFGQAVGLDVSETMIARARERSEGQDLPVEFVVGSAYDLPFADDHFDACRCERVLQHLDEPLAAIGEMVRVVRPGGKVLLLDPDFGAIALDSSYREIHERLRAFGQKSRQAQPGDGWRGRQLWGLAHQAGLVDVEAEGMMLIITSFAPVNALGGIELQTEAAVEAGAVSRQEADLYLDDLRERDATDRFFAGITGIQVVGTVQETAKQ